MNPSTSNLATDSPGLLYSPNHIYIHFPYCLYKCHYCDFNSHAYDEGQIPRDDYVKSLLRELDWRRDRLQKTGDSCFVDGVNIDTIFFGGGTPSLMNASDVEVILKKLSRHFVFSKNIEVTLEANPGTLTKTKLEDFARAGINRVSVGVQSLNPAYLERYGRIHTAEAAREVLRWLGGGAVPRASADLIYGFPGQALADWQSELKEITIFGLTHLSCYALTVEEGTKLARQVRDGEIEAPDSDLQAQMQEWTYEFLNDAGFEAYEISNFAKPGFESRHNLGYWHYHSYLGLGAGAVSQFVKINPCFGDALPILSENNESSKADAVIRQTNHKAPEHYLRTILDRKNIFVPESIDSKTAMKEYLMMGLRLQEGISVSELERLFALSFWDVFGDVACHYVKRGWIKIKEGRVSHTPQGFFYNDAVLKALFAVPLHGGSSPLLTK